MDINLDNYTRDGKYTVALTVRWSNTIDSRPRKVRRDDEIAPFTVAIAHESPAVSSLIREIGSFAIEIERLAQPVNAKHDCRLSIVKHGRYKSRIAYWNSYKW